MTLGQRLAFYRKKSCLTQQQLGKMINVSAQAVSKWENDQAEPDVATICRLSQIYQISTDALLTGKEHEAPAMATPQAPTKRRMRWGLVTLLILLAAMIGTVAWILFANDTAALPLTPLMTDSPFITTT